MLTFNFAASAEGVSLHTTLYGGRTAAHQLHILIVGCGMGGLAAAHCLGKAGHKVTLFESAAAIGEVGAGIQVSPNAARLLRRWGAGPALDAVGVRPHALVLRRYAAGARVGYTRWTDMEARYGAPYYHVHRADLHRILVDLALHDTDTDTAGVTLRLGARVMSVDPDADTPSLTLASGEELSADVIIGADGVFMPMLLCRKHFLEKSQTEEVISAKHMQLFQCVPSVPIGIGWRGGGWSEALTAYCVSE